MAHDDCYTHLTNGQIAIYLDAVLIYTQNVSTPNIPTLLSGRIGRAMWPSNEFWTGKLDDIGIWNRALSICEIQDLYIANTQACSLSSLPDILITEIMYNPAESGTDSTEYIEIYNNKTIQ